MQPYEPASARCVMIGLDLIAATAIASQLSQVTLAPEATIGWGDLAAFHRLRRRPPALLVLDAWTAAAPVDPHWYVRALGRLAPVVALTHGTDGADRLLDLGAHDVLDRTAPAAVMAAHLRAHLRRLGEPAPASTPSTWDSASPQRLLLEWLQGLEEGCCCHELRHLLGPPRRPLSLPALRARMRRIGPLLGQSGRTLTETRSWGHSWYLVEEQATLARPAPGVA